VVGTTRSLSKADALKAAGVEPVVLNVFEAALLTHAVSVARPDLVIHQLTDLPPGLDPNQMAEGTRRNDAQRRNPKPRFRNARIGRASSHRAKHCLDVRAWAATTLRGGPARYQCAGRAGDNSGGRRDFGAAHDFIAAD
jgi:hypothetical protein